MTQKRKQDKDIRKAEMPKVLPERRPKGFSRMTFELAEDPTVLGYARSIKELKDARDKDGVLSDKNIFHPMNTEGASVDDIRRMIDEAKLIDRIRGQKELEKEEEVKKPVELDAAKGTSVPKQMEMFEEGGLRDEGGTKDPVSGNDVPPGSTQEEVRDDIPAQLSEGEFVFPADVVRYIGLEKLMMMRQEAKAGLARMEAMGQMGNADEATIPDDAPFNPSQDDLPFTMEDLDMEEEKEYNEGGVVKAQTGTFVNQGTGTFTQPSQFQGQNLPSFQPTMTTPNYNVPSVPLVQPFKLKVDQEKKTPTFKNLLGQTPGQYDEMREYVNEAGAKLQIPFKDGQPIYPIPEGYTFVDPEEEKVKDPKVTEVKSPTSRVVDTSSGDGTVQVGTTLRKTGTGVSKPIDLVFDKQTPEQLKSNLDRMNQGDRTLSVMSAIQDAKGYTGLSKAFQQAGVIALAAMAPGPIGPVTIAAQLLKSGTYNPVKALQEIGDPKPQVLNNILEAYKTVDYADPSGYIDDIKAAEVGRNETISLAMYGKSIADVTKDLGVRPTFRFENKPGGISIKTGQTFDEYGSSNNEKGDNPEYASFKDFSRAISAMRSGYYGTPSQAKKAANAGNKEAQDYINRLDKEIQEEKKSVQPEVTVQQQSQDSGDGGISEPDYGGSISDAQQSVEDYGADYVGIAKGGLLKKKPKVKRMKRGGLASKK